MNRASATAAAVVLLPVVVFIAIPAARYFSADQETLTLDDAARRNAQTGKFVQLSEGITHYELGGPPDGRTVLLIAHRPELVAHADRIVELGGGTAVREEAA